MNTVDRYVDVPLIDSVFGYCALNNIDVNFMSDMKFIEVTRLLALTAEKNPEWIAASMEIRKYYPVCHADCHIRRIQKLMESNGVWPQGAGPNKGPKGPAQIIDFPTPTNPTKH